MTVQQTRQSLPDMICCLDQLRKCRVVRDKRCARTAIKIKSSGFVGIQDL